MSGLFLPWQREATDGKKLPSCTSDKRFVLTFQIPRTLHQRIFTFPFIGEIWIAKHGWNTFGKTAHPI